MTIPPEDETRIAEPADTRRAADAHDGSTPSAATHTSSSGWLSSSGDIDHGRFMPGTLLGGRYRIVGRLGRGGMGEVYRADDLKLGQSVALKFLPSEVDQDPARLTQLHTEVRMARQVSHPNVCRVYDIDEVDGHAFLSMEYVDGEDLASLLRRIGRFPVDRALELARQICAGLAAAHERGVVHRDFKPANVMIDAGGRARITDFGLAGASGESIRAGTPAYMAPEQLAGGEVTTRSDIYALGLVLYELFTGRRAIEAKSLAELVRRREEAGITPPSMLVSELDAAIDRAILRCIERDPALRPASALAVAAALPGGDPLAAALAAGETPSPEMVADAGETEALAPLRAIAGLVATLAALLAFAWLADRTLLTSAIPLEKPPAVLAERANEVARALGYGNTPADTAQGFFAYADYLSHIRQHPDERMRQMLATGRPPALGFWYRTSPRMLVPLSPTSTSASRSDPPLTVTGMLLIQLDTQGRLAGFQAVPPQVEEPVGAAGPTNWDAVFTLADLRRGDFTQVPSTWTPPVHSDERIAWEGPMPGMPDTKLRVEGAAYRGRPVYVDLIGPWTRPSRMQEAPESAQSWAVAITGVLVVLVLVAAVVVTRHNLRRRRGDVTSAFRITAIVFGVTLVAQLIGRMHVPDVQIEMSALFEAVGDAMFAGGVIWVLYIALEPYVRRFWPTTIVSWSRFVTGRFRDPQVGRDILVGCFAGTLIGVFERLLMFVPPMLGYPTSPYMLQRITELEGVRAMVARTGQIVVDTGFNALWFIFGIVVVRLVVRRVWITAAITYLFLVFLNRSMLEVPPVWFSAAMMLTLGGAMAFVILRFGLLATVVLFFINFWVTPANVTLDPDRWYFGMSIAMLLSAAALAVYGFHASRGGQPLLGRRFLD